MNKEERHQIILELVEKQNIIKVTEIVERLDVTEMTVRRDLQELEDLNLLTRVHGGARRLETNNRIPFLELSHIEKRGINLRGKQEIAKIIAENINDNETVFLGSGSTIELVYNYLNLNFAKIITNSIHVFNQFKHDSRYELILIGGAYRSKTGSFTGTIANELMSSIYVQKAFVGVNGINDTMVFSANEDEGGIQRTILNNSNEKYIIADNEKFNKMDFYQFYNLKEADYLITDKKLSPEIKEKYSRWIKIIN